jgi:hypothetical protein
MPLDNNYNEGKAVSDQQPSKVKVWAQTQLGKALFKVYQLKMAWAKAFGRKPKADGVQQGETTTSID